MPPDSYARLQQPDLGYSGRQASDEPTDYAQQQRGRSGGGSSQARPAPKQSKRTKGKPKTQPAKVRVRVDDMDGKLKGDVTILNQVAAQFSAAGVDLDMAYGKFTEKELAFDGIIPVLIVSEPLTTAQSDRWTAIQDAMNLELFVQPTVLANELSLPGTGSSTRQIIGSTRTWLSGTAMGDPLHAPVAISAGRLDAFINQKVPQQFASQVFVNEISITIAHECGHAFGLVLSSANGPDKHPSNAQDVMSRDTFDSLGGINSLPTTAADWQALLAVYKFPEFSAADVKILKKVQQDFQEKVKAKRNIEWKFNASSKSKDRKPNPAHL